MKNPELKKKFIEEFIPSLERMLEKEKNHLYLLELFLEENGSSTEIENSTHTSKEFLKELEFRLAEYKNYVENL